MTDKNIVCETSTLRHIKNIFEVMEIFAHNIKSNC